MQPPEINVSSLNIILIVLSVTESIKLFITPVNSFSICLAFITPSLYIILIYYVTQICQTKKLIIFKKEIAFLF